MHCFLASIIDLGTGAEVECLRGLAEDIWELYDTRTDFSLVHDLAIQHPEKLAEMQQLFMQEAERNQVLPIVDRTVEQTLLHQASVAQDIEVEPEELQSEIEKIRARFAGAAEFEEALKAFGMTEDELQDSLQK